MLIIRNPSYKPITTPTIHKNNSKKVLKNFHPKKKKAYNHNFPFLILTPPQNSTLYPLLSILPLELPHHSYSPIPLLSSRRLTRSHLSFPFQFSSIPISRGSLLVIDLPKHQIWIPNLLFTSLPQILDYSPFIPSHC